MERLHAQVHGYVQGVGFRAFVAREARRLGLSGWVANRSDGAVEVVVDGERGRLEDLLSILRHGPSEAEVQRVDSQWLAAVGDLSGFHIRL